MKYFTLIIVFLSLNILAEPEECIFDQDDQKEFNNNYVALHKSARLDKDGITIVIKRDKETIRVNRGGCVHFGVTIVSQTSSKYTEAQLFTKAIKLVKEFGSELIDYKDLANTLSNKK